MRIVRIFLTITVFNGLAGCGLSLDSLTAASKEGEIYYFEPKSVPRAICQPGDAVETGLQGQVPVSDRMPNSTRSSSPYYCNLYEIGSLKGEAWATLDLYEDCAYYGMGVGVGGTQTVWVTDTPAPGTVVPGPVLMTPGMQDPWESMKTNAARGLLATGGHVAADPFLDIYDISIDCRAPVLKASMPMDGANGHEGWFSPDGMTYWMAGGALYVGGGGLPPGIRGGAVAMNIADPSFPAEVAHSDAPGHGGSMSEDGTRGYWCSTDPNGLLIMDTSDVQFRRPNAQIHQISLTPVPENSVCQAAYKVTYQDHPYVIIYGESHSRQCVETEEGPPLNSYSIPVIIDIADEKNPKIVSRILREVDLPENCDAVAGDGSGPFVYDTHHCTPDRLHDPTILACSDFVSGERIFDIRDPLNVKEIAYYNVSQPVGPAGLQFLGTIARPVVRADRAEIWFTNEKTGFHVVKFADGVWPWPESLKCSDKSDWLFHQQNPTLDCE